MWRAVLRGKHCYPVQHIRHHILCFSFGLFGLVFCCNLFREKCTVKITLFSLVFVVFVEKNVP